MALLTSNKLKVLNDIGVSMIQITLDGSPETHNARRPFKNGSPSFDVIINNLISCKELIKNKVSLRINVDKNNVNDIRNVISILDKNKLQNYVTPHLGKVQSENDCCADSTCYKAHEFVEIEYDFGISQQDYKTRMKRKYPRPILNYCCADMQNGFVVAPDGKMYKCYSDIGNESKAVSSLGDEAFGKKQLL